MSPGYSTRQARALAGYLEALEGFEDAQEVHRGLAAAGVRVSLSTVYRRLEALAADGDLEVVRTADGVARYRPARTATRHQHLVCRDCGRVEEVADAALATAVARLAATTGYGDLELAVDIVGRCAGCRQVDESA